MKRSSGVLMHISSLPGEYSIGSFGKQAKTFVDFLVRCGFSWWQVLPFGLVDECNSPYKSYSAFAGNPWFVDLDILHGKGLITDEELRDARQKTPYVCEFNRLNDERMQLLLAASKRVNNRSEIDEYITNDKYLDNFCRFMALKTANGLKAWNEWENDNVDPDEVFMWKFIQHEFFEQWDEIKRYANGKGVKIIGDIPIYMAYDSCDVWSNRELFQLDENDDPTGVAGVPPDYFSEDGQLWGNPLYDWDRMEKDDFRWWRDRISHQLKLFDGLRIDHFRGIESYWSVPYGAKTAKEGEWKKGPAEKLVDAIRDEAGKDRMIIAEDLGIITDDVIKLVEYSGFPGMRVVQFAFFGDNDSPHMPHNYPNNSIAYTGTHDNNTLLGYLWEMDDNQRKQCLEYVGFPGGDWGNTGCDYIMRTMFASHAGVLVVPIQDLLGYGSDTRINVPGRTDDNWSYRVTAEQINSINVKKFSDWNRVYAR